MPKSFGGLLLLMLLESRILVARMCIERLTQGSAI